MLLSWLAAGCADDRLRGSTGGLSCASAPTCKVAVEVAGSCLLEDVSDGTPCSDGCVVEGECVAGQCVGAHQSCDDGNPCTVDACDSSGGCVSTDAVCEAPENPCLAAICDPATGCSTVELPDGVACGESAGCVTRDVCFSGQCVAVAVPEGVACGQASPCQPQGTCRNQTCDREPPIAMELWAHWLGNIDQLVLDDDSNVYYLVRPPSPMESAYVESRAPDGAVRWRRDDLGGGSLAWNDGRLYVVASGWASWAPQQTVRVLALDDASGATVWTRDLADALPPGWDATAVAPEDVFLEGSPAVISSTGDVSVLVAAIENRGVMQWANLGTWLATVDGQSGAVEGSDPLPTLEPRELALTAGGKTLAYGEDGSSGHRLVGFGASGSTWDRGVCAASGILAVSEERALVYAPCGTGPGGLSLIDTQSGTELAPIDEWTVAAVADQDRVFLRSQGSIVVLDSKTGQQLARSPFGVWDTSLHLASSGEIIVYRERSSPNEASALVSVSPSGEIVFACQMDSLQPRVTALGDGVFYVADADYRLKAFALPGVSRALSGWTAPHGDESGRRRPLP